MDTALLRRRLFLLYVSRSFNRSRDVTGIVLHRYRMCCSGDSTNQIHSNEGLIKCVIAVRKGQELLERNWHLGLSARSRYWCRVWLYACEGVPHGRRARPGVRRGLRTAAWVAGASFRAPGLAAATDGFGSVCGARPSLNHQGSAKHIPGPVPPHAKRD